ncbi:ATPase, T2SS/T4P/T4SS family [Pelotomaculum propionicicum]|uniref:ATPase, T2SS/T4P/T4SS family n=1 Tax=Pelotomaculum propionicicum TaxID=258475 RepID=UPI003B7F0BDB
MFWKKKKPQAPIEPEEKIVGLEKAIELVQNALVKSESDGAVFDDAVGGLVGAKEKAIKIITQILYDNKIIVEGYSFDIAAEEIYRMAWGLGVVEELYRDPSIDEIRINDYDKIFVSKRGKNERAGVRFNDTEDARRVISRLYTHDVGISLTETTPVVESVRQDGSRLTALGKPVTETTVAIIRKHDTFEMTVENLCRTGTLDEKTWDVLQFLVRGRANILIIGGFGSGKSTLQRRLVKELPPSLRIITLESDREMLLRKHYPDRDIIEIEEHANLEGSSLKELLRTTFRLSPDVIIIGEFRGAGEAVEAIKSCRVLRGSMATAHFSSAEEAVEGTAMLMLEEGLTLPFELAKIRVARAYNVAVELFSDTERGIKKVVRLTEICVDEKNSKVVYKTLLEWVPSTEDYLGPGEWVLKNKPSNYLINQMARYIPSTREVDALWKSALTS